MAVDRAGPSCRPSPRTSGSFAERVDRDPYETAPAGNAVVLEEQMAKLNHTAVSHRLASELYRKHLGDDQHRDRPPLGRSSGDPEVRSEHG